MDTAQNLQRVKSLLNQGLAAIGYDGAVGVAEFKSVYGKLMPVQRSRLADICGDRLQEFLRDGSFVCVGLAYPESAIDCIDIRLEDGSVDRDAWNVYAREYHKLNRLLNNISKDITDLSGGILIPATVEGIDVKNVKEYFGMTVSHRVIAENAGLGWRGKNELIVNEKFSCALRFASVMTSLPLVHGDRVKASCGECQACLDACSFLKNKDRFEDYRENCRRYISHLGLEGEVCGKCVKACYRHSIFNSRFKLGQP